MPKMEQNEAHEWMIEKVLPRIRDLTEFGAKLFITDLFETLFEHGPSTEWDSERMAEVQYVLDKHDLGVWE